MKTFLGAVEHLNLIPFQRHPVFGGMPPDDMGFQIGGGVGRTVLAGQIHGLVPDLEPAAAFEDHIQGGKGKGLRIRVAAAQGDHARHPHDRDKLPNRRRLHPLNPPGQQWLNVHQILLLSIGYGASPSYQ
jgi:hypothetical protein